MKKIILCLFTFSFFISCSSYKIQTAIEKKNNILKLEKPGILLKLSKYNLKDKNKYLKSLSFSLKGYKENKPIKIIKDTSDKISSYNSELDRFCQLSMEKKLMRYKSIGAIKLYLLNNQEEFEKIFKENDLDSIILFEVDSSFSVEVQFFDFETTIVIVDKNYQIHLLNYQAENYEVDEIDEEKIQSFLFNHINSRLLDKLVKFNFLDKRSN